MTNALTAASPTYWSRNAGRKLYKTMVSRSFVSFEEQSLVDNDGRIVDRPYRSNVVAEDYVKGTAATAQDLTYVTDPLTIDQFHDVLMYVDDIDKLQNKYKTVRLWSEEAGKRLGLRADANLLYEAFSATPDIDDSDFGGTADDGTSLTVSKVPQIFAQINEELDDNDVDEERFFCFTPLFFNKLWQYIGGKESMLGDKVAVAGHVGRYAGLELYKSNNLTGTARWTPADNPTDGASIVIEGITFHFVDTISTVAGNIHIGGTTAETIDNLVALINAGGVTSDEGVSNVSLSVANRRAVQSWIAVDGATYIEVRVKGTPSLTVTTSEALDTWDAKYTNQVMIAGRKKTAIDAVFQISRMGIVDTAMASTVSAGKRGTNVMPLITYGKKVFNQGKNELVKLLVRADS